jgi:hypothetical protein
MITIMAQIAQSGMPASGEDCSELGAHQIPNPKCQFALPFFFAPRTALLRFERSHVDGEAVLYIGLQ